MSTSHGGMLAMALLVTACVGCGPGGPDIASVKGKVTMDGKPLPNASVLFIPENGRPGAGRTDANGDYTLTFTQGREGAIPGRNTVRISTKADPYEDSEGNMVPASPEKIPMKYNSQTTLEFDVKPGEENIANFDLDSEGRIATDAGGY